MNFAIIGLGGRGQTYAHFIKYYGSKVVSVCDTDLSKKEIAMREYDVDAANFFTDEDMFFQEKRADALVIATLDTLHYRQAMKALELGYDLLLEKPIAVSIKECEDIAKKATELNRKVVVCHVLRYSPFYMGIKDLLDEGAVGDIVSVYMSEEIGYYHFAHSYVRGNWRNTEVSTPLILAKNCHDVDMLCWLVGEKCLSVSSVGGLKEFKSENAPQGAERHCVDCPHKDSCKYSCFYLYNNAEYEKLAGLAKHGRLGKTKSEIDASLSDRNNPYSRCVYYCDNNVCDHQTVNFLFDKQITGQLLSIAQSNEMARHIKIFGTEGTIYDQNGDIILEKLNGRKQIIKVEYPKGGYEHHAGGDVSIVRQFIDYVGKGIKTKNITDITVSVAAHKAAFLAEESRLENGKCITCEGNL